MRNLHFFLARVAAILLFAIPLVLGWRFLERDFGLHLFVGEHFIAIFMISALAAACGLLLSRRVGIPRGH